MIIDNLYERVLINPAKEGGDELFIVSGYSSATFLRKHLKDILDINPEVKINLIKGMRQTSDHSAYLGILKKFPGSFDGYYYDGSPQVHSKTYSWIKNNSPLIGFSGSANYSQPGFCENEQQNQMTSDSAKEIKDYFHHLKLKSVKIQDYTPDESEVIQSINTGDSVLPGEGVWIEPNRSARISLLTNKTRQIAKRDSLNWGQRPGREPNQACLNIRGDAKTDGFLPPIGFTFTLLTDDAKTMDCTRQQQGGKAISTTYDNSEIGIYFRNRLNVQLGEFVKTEDLVKYGRTDFVLKKINQETFYLDFSKPN